MDLDDVNTERFQAAQGPNEVDDEEFGEWLDELGDGRATILWKRAREATEDIYDETELAINYAHELKKAYLDDGLKILVLEGKVSTEVDSEGYLVYNLTDSGKLDLNEG